MPCKQGFIGDVKGRECLGKRLLAAVRINVRGRAYYCGRARSSMRAPARD